MAEIPNRTLQRGLDMLELLGAHAEGLALCELAQALRLPRSTAGLCHAAGGHGQIPPGTEDV